MLEHTVYEEKRDTAVSFMYETVEGIQFQFLTRVSNKTQLILVIMSQRGPHRSCRNNECRSKRGIW